MAALFAIAYPSGYIQARGCTDPSVDPGTCTYRNTQTDGIYEVTVTTVAGTSSAARGWYVSAVTAET